MSSRFTIALLCCGMMLATILPAAKAQQATANGVPAQASPKRRRQPPPPVVPMEETAVAQRQYSAGNYEAAVIQAKAALNRNERFTPAMLVMAKSYYRLRKYEWVRTLWETMQASGASNAERAEIFQILAFMEREKQNGPQAIAMLKKAAESRPEHAIIWNNLGAQYLEAKNYRDAAPALERAVQLQPAFTKAHMNLGSAYRGLKDYERAQAEYHKALQLFPNFADAVFNLGILYLDAEKMENMDTIAKFNTAIGHFQRYKQMMQAAGQGLSRDPVDQYLIEAQEGIKKEQKRLERLQKQQERDRQRAAQKAAQPAAPSQGAVPAAPPGN